MRRSLRIHAPLLAMLLWSMPAAAQRVYDGGGPTGAPGWDVWGDALLADDFEVGPGAPLVFDAVRFWGLSAEALSPASTTDVFWKLFLDDGSGTPGAALEEGTSTASLTRGAGSSWQFDIDVGGQSLDAGIYWLALNAPLLGDLIWEGSGGGRGDGFVSSYTWDQATWGQFSGSGNLAFELHAVTVTPEPASLLLLGTGLLGVGSRLRRRRGRGEPPA